jgi:spermidine/putrescine transport system substrate-binding protein
MRTTKQTWTILFSLLMLASLVLAACAPAATPTEAPAPTQAPASTEAPVATAAPTEAPTAAGPSTQTGNLVMLDWSGYELPEFWKQFATQYPNVKVDFSFMAESAEAYAKLQSGFDADLVHPCSNYWKIMVDEGLVQPIDTSKLSHWKDINPDLAKQGEFNGKQYWIPWDWGFESILVRKDKVTTMPTSWADLWNPEYKGHLALFDSGESAHIITALALGMDPWTTTPEQDAQIKQKLMELMPNVLTIWDSQTTLDQQIASGDVWLAANAWNASYIGLLNGGTPVEYIDPKEGRAGYLCGFAIPTKSKNVELATAMIDAYLAPDSQAKLANDYGYGIVNNAAIPLVDPKTAELLGLTDPNVISRTHFYQFITPEQRQAWTDTWSEVKTSK